MWQMVVISQIASHIGGHTASPNMDVHETGRQTVSPDVASSHASDQICGRRSRQRDACIWLSAPECSKSSFCLDVVS